MKTERYSSQHQTLWLDQRTTISQDCRMAQLPPRTLLKYGPTLSTRFIDLFSQRRCLYNLANELPFSEGSQLLETGRALCMLSTCSTTELPPPPRCLSSTPSISVRKMIQSIPGPLCMRTQAAQQRPLNEGGGRAVTLEPLL